MGKEPRKTGPATCPTHVFLLPLWGNGEFGASLGFKSGLPVTSDETLGMSLTLLSFGSLICEMRVVMVAPSQGHHEDSNNYC